MRDKWETSVKSCGPRHPEWETSVGDKCRLMQPKEPRVGDKWETSVNSCRPRQPEWETSVEDKWETSGRQVQTHAGSFVASCLSSSSFSSLICRLCIFISLSLKAIESKIAQSQNQSAKLATTKHIIYTHLTMEKTHNDAHARSKRKSEIDSETVQCSQSGRQEPHKAKLFQEELLRKKNIATLHTLLTSQPLWNEDSIAVRPE